jgi:tetratricopeptide (TPR) repeat protein
MRIVISKILVLTLLIMSSVLKAQDKAQVEAAAKAYDAKKYKEAIENYEKIIEEGYKSFELFYNLGNAYYRDKQLGKAIYNYELARKINPNDEDLRINLGIASSKTIDKIDSKENFFIGAVKSNVLSSFSTSGWAWLNISCLVVFCICVFLFITSTSLLIKRVTFLFGILFLISTATSYFLGYSALQSKNNNKFAIVIVTESKIMNEPTSSASLKFSLHEGTKIRVIDTNGDWVLIKLDNGNEGWTRVSDIGVI